jgi:hypothetical protein
MAGSSSGILIVYDIKLLPDNRNMRDASLKGMGGIIPAQHWCISGLFGKVQAPLFNPQTRIIAFVFARSSTYVAD